MSCCRHLSVLEVSHCSPIPCGTLPSRTIQVSQNRLATQLRESSINIVKMNPRAMAVISCEPYWCLQIMAVQRPLNWSTIPKQNHDQLYEKLTKTTSYTYFPHLLSILSLLKTKVLISTPKWTSYAHGTPLSVPLSHMKNSISFYMFSLLFISLLRNLGQMAEASLWPRSLLQISRSIAVISCVLRPNISVLPFAFNVFALGFVLLLLLFHPCGFLFHVCLPLLTGSFSMVTSYHPYETSSTMCSSSHRAPTFKWSFWILMCSHFSMKIKHFEFYIKR